MTRRTGRALARAVWWLAALAAVAVAAASWHYSSLILGPDGAPARRGQGVLAHDDSTIALVPTARAMRPGRWALEWDRGCGAIDSILAVGPGRVVRRFHLAAGRPPDTTARIAGFAFDADPRSWIGAPYEPVDVPARIGRLHSWLVPGRSATWAVLVHGRGVTKAEVLRMLPAYRALGLG